MNFDEFKEQEKSEFAEKPLSYEPETSSETNSISDAPSEEPKERVFTEESAVHSETTMHDASMHMSDDTQKSEAKPYEFYGMPGMKQPDNRTDAYAHYRQYSEYSNRMNVRRPVDASFRPEYQPYQNMRPQGFGEQKSKKKNGIIICVSIICALFIFSLGALSIYAMVNSPLGTLIGFGISNALGQSETILPGGFEDNAPVQSSPILSGGVENPPSFDIISVKSPEIEKIYDESGREILNANQIYEKVSPSVVSVSTRVAIDNGLGYSNKAGSGIVFSADGYIITNAHVLADAMSVSIQLPTDSETVYPAMIIGLDEKADIAVLKIDAEGLVSAEFGDSDLLKVGDLAVAIGNPTVYDLQGATTQGIISGINREIVVDDNGRTLTLIQTDAAINPGNSGGPLINCYGQVIGINTIGFRSASYEGLNFAIPSNNMKPIVDELLAYGYVKGYPSIGITGQPVTAYQAEMYGAPLGIIVATVNEKSDAFKKGLQPYDIITHINQQSVTSVAELNTVKNRYTVGDSVTLTIFRDGKRFDLKIKLMDEIDLQ